MERADNLTDIVLPDVVVRYQVQDLVNTVSCPRVAAEAHRLRGHDQMARKFHTGGDDRFFASVFVGLVFGVSCPVKTLLLDPSKKDGQHTVEVVPTLLNTGRQTKRDNGFENQ